MENWILVVGYDRPHFEAARKDWLRLNVYLHSVDTAIEAIEQCPCRKYLAVIASYNVPNIAPLIDFMSGTNQLPLVILSQNDSGTKFAESILRGANTFIIDPDKLIESIKENKEIIDRLAKMPPNQRKALGILTHRDIFMLVDYRKIFVRNREITLAKSEFEILQLLLSQVGRVFTYEQIYLHAYGDDIPVEITINSVRCHIFRIRQRLRDGPEPIDYIDSVRSIGYRIAV